MKLNQIVRNYGKGASAAFLLSLFSPLANPVQSQIVKPVPKKYNVLFIISDDLNNDMHCYGNNLVKTPNLDRLKANGIIFNHSYCQYALCLPSRVSFLTGYRPDKTGVEDLTTDFRDNLPDAVTLPQLFRNNGYFSGRVGKIFHQGVPGEIGTDGMDDTISWNQRINPIGRDKTDEDKVTWVNPEKGVPLGGTLGYLMADGTDEEQTDGMVAAEVIKMMESHRNSPFFIGAGFYRPHTPYIAPKKYFDMYPLDKIKLPEEPADDWDFKPEAAKTVNPLNFGLSVEDRKKSIRAYYAAITFMDAQVGKLLDALDRLGLKDNTVIIFSGDHGYNLGQHGQWMKRSIFEHAARMPLLISVPGLTKGEECNRVVEMIDIYPTSAELCGLTVPSDLAGTSLLPLLKDPHANWDHPAFSQVFRQPSKRRPNVKRVKGRSVRTERYRYSEWNGGAEGIELYDYQTDPNEFHNLAVDPEYSDKVKELSALLRKSYSTKY